jgi:hypothetical protein
MRNAVTPAGVAVLTVLAITAAPRASFAQAGSTGGTIGKTDKSLSGDAGSGSHQPQQAEPSRHSAAGKKPAGNSCQKIVGTWAWQYPYGASEVVFNADGSGRNPLLTAKWTCAGGGAIIRWSHGTADHVSISGDGNTLAVSVRDCGSFGPPLCSVGMSFKAIRK